MVVGLSAASQSSSSMPSLMRRLSAAVGAPFSKQQLLGHALIHAAAGGQVERGDHVSPFIQPPHCELGQDRQPGDDLEVVDAGELALHGVRAAGREQAGHGAFLASCRPPRPRRRQATLRRAHVLALLGRLVEAGAGTGIGQVAPEAEALEPVEDLLGLVYGSSTVPSSPTCTR
jgi:hypothetical protein